MSQVNAASANLRGAVDLSALVRRANAPAKAAGDIASNGIVFDTDDASFASVAERSATVPVLIEFADERSGDTGVAAAVRSYQGRVLLAKADLTASPQLIQAFQVQQVPFLAAIVAGRPLPLFAGVLPEDQLREVIDQVLALAAQQGVSGVATPSETVDGEAEAQPEPLPPLHQEAYDAIERGDLSAAIHAYETAITQNPRDGLAVAGLAQVRLMHRLSDADAGTVRQAGAAKPDDVASQLAVADLDVAGGHLDDAFGRLLDLFATATPESRALIRARLLEYFEIAGPDDERVPAARTRLANLLF